jgi:hypothetical protein
VTVTDIQIDTTVTDVLDRIRDSVWVLVRRGMVDSAVVLLEANLADFARAYRREYGIQPDDELPAVIDHITEEATTCVSLDHVHDSCHVAIARESLIPRQMCAWCRENPPELQVMADDDEPVVPEPDALLSAVPPPSTGSIPICVELVGELGPIRLRLTARS